MFKEMDKNNYQSQVTGEISLQQEEKIEKKINPEGGAEICVRFRTTPREKHDHYTSKKVALP